MKTSKHHQYICLVLDDKKKHTHEEGKNNWLRRNLEKRFATVQVKSVTQLLL